MSGAVRPCDNRGMNSALSPQEVQTFHDNGYLIVRALASSAECAHLLAVARDHLARAVPPLEYEADVGYPGAPPTLSAPGGRTVRRLLQAYARDAAFASWAQDSRVVTRVRQLLDAPLVLPQAHHNCVMTKQPHFSSETHWHQDIRYWSYTRPDLVNVWLALGSETRDNGCLMVLPGTHRQELVRARFDEALFLRADLPENQALIATRVYAELAAGDVLFFHARCLHAAARNRTDTAKFSLVFTYRAQNNEPLANTRSTGVAEIRLD